MSKFDPEKFEDKYIHYFTELQRAYKNAFEKMNNSYDSQLIHAIDQLVLNESEPVFDEIEGFSIALPEDPYPRLQGHFVVDEAKFDAVLDVYVETLESELEAIFET